MGVRSRQRSGKQLLVVRFSQFDPNQTLTRSCGALVCAMLPWEPVRRVRGNGKAETQLQIGLPDAEQRSRKPAIIAIVEPSEGITPAPRWRLRSFLRGGWVPVNGPIWTVR